MSGLIERIRFYHYISAVLLNQQADSLCASCKALSNTAASLINALAELEKAHPDELRHIGAEASRLLEGARNRLVSISVSDDAIGQKKAGNCKMPEGVCFVKTSKAILSRI